MRKHAVFGQARVTVQHVPWNTCCRHEPTLPLHDYKRMSNTPARTPEHKSTWNYTYTNTLTLIRTLPAARPKLQTTFSIGLEPQKQWFQKKVQRCGNTESPCLDKPELARGAGGTTLSHECRTHRPIAPELIPPSFSCLLQVLQPSPGSHHLSARQ